MTEVSRDHFKVRTEVSWTKIVLFLPFWRFFLHFAWIIVLPFWRKTCISYSLDDSGANLFDNAKDCMTKQVPMDTSLNLDGCVLLSSSRSLDMGQGTKSSMGTFLILVRSWQNSRSARKKKREKYVVPTESKKVWSPRLDSKRKNHLRLTRCLAQSISEEKRSGLKQHCMWEGWVKGIWQELKDALGEYIRQIQGEEIVMGGGWEGR